MREMKSTNGPKVSGLRYSTGVNVALVSCAHQMPLEVLLLLCIPIVDPDKEDKNWRRPLNCLQLVTAPLVCVFAFQSGQCKCVTVKRQQVAPPKQKQKTKSALSPRILLSSDANYKIQGQFPLWLLILLLGLFLSAIVFFTTRNDCPPRYHPVGFCYDSTHCYKI